MAPFDELQLLWQSQEARPTPRFDAAAAATAFRRYGRRQDLINTAKSILIGGVLVQAVITSPHRPMVLFVVSLILFSGVIALIAEWRNQRAIARFDFGAPSIAFVRSTLARLEQQRNPLHTREFAILFGAVFLGYNLIVYASYDRSTMAERILGHAIGVTLPALLYLVGRALRAKRWESECVPLMQRLRHLQETLEEQPE